MSTRSIITYMHVPRAARLESVHAHAYAHVDRRASMTRSQGLEGGDPYSQTMAGTYVFASAMLYLPF